MTLGGAHRALWQVFSRDSEQQRDFLFRAETDAWGRPRFITLSAQPPVETTGAQLWTIIAKPFNPKLSVGDRLGFSLRANATVARKGQGQRRSQRHDLVMDAKWRADTAGHPFDLVVAMREAGERWLIAQARQAGFEIAQGVVDRIGDDGLFEKVTANLLSTKDYQQHRLARKGGNPIRFSTVDFEGVLVVREPGTFLEQVRLGFGHQKAFGCGLMVLRKVVNEMA